jgi:hypothetical protein
MALVYAKHGRGFGERQFWHKIPRKANIQVICVAQH